MDAIELGTIAHEIATGVNKSFEKNHIFNATIYINIYDTVFDHLNSVHDKAYDEGFKNGTECLQPTDEALQKAREEGLKEGLSCPGREIKEAYDRGFAEALKEAAKIAENHSRIKGAHIHPGFNYCVQEVAGQIRSLLPRAKMGPAR